MTTRKRDDFYTEAENLWEIGKAADSSIEKIALELPKYLRAAYILEQVAIVAARMSASHKFHHQAVTWLTEPTFWQRIAAGRLLGRNVQITYAQKGFTKED